MTLHEPVCPEVPSPEGMKGQPSSDFEPLSEIGLFGFCSPCVPWGTGHGVPTLSLVPGVQ